MGIFSFFSKGNKVSAAEIFANLSGKWAGPGKIYTPAGVQNYRVELSLAPEGLGVTGKMVSYFESGTVLDTPVQLKVEGGAWHLVYTQTNVHGRGKLCEGRLEFQQKDPSGRSAGQTEEVWSFLSAEHLFIESFILGEKGEREPFLKAVLQKS